MRIASIVLPVILAAALSACGGPAGPPVPDLSQPESALPTVPAHCASRQAADGQPLPDPTCTPGAVDAAIRPPKLGATICRRGWTATVRPPLTYTEPLKRALMVSYGATDPIGDYELDHLVPLELGGDPRAVANLWPEPGASPNLKDTVELAANHAVCGGRMSLQHAQRGFESDWTALGRELGVPGL
jgi:hypothetical protein